MSVTAPRFQKKGPATVAAVPSHGPAHTRMKTKNDMTDSTPAAGLTNRAPIFELENPTLELERFASILSNLSEDVFDRRRRKEGRLEGEVILQTRDDAIDNIEFVVGKVYELANDIGAATTRAINAQIAAEGGGAVAGGPAIARLVAKLRGGETPMEVAQAAIDLARGAAA
jgi:hypothetical protein